MGIGVLLTFYTFNAEQELTEQERYLPFPKPSQLIPVFKIEYGLFSSFMGLGIWLLIDSMYYSPNKKKEGEDGESPPF
jgi:hypothetical protein